MFRKIIISIIVASMAALLFSAEAFALSKRKDYFYKPQMGVWFGPVTPVYKTAEVVDTDLGGGVFFRYNTPVRLLKVSLDTSYQNFESKGVNELTVVPVLASLVYLLPINLPVRFQLKAGAGSSYVKIWPDKDSQWYPAFTGGFELSFPAGRIVNIGLRIDYLYLLEKHIEGSDRSGHIINSGISLYFNI